MADFVNTYSNTIIVIQNCELQIQKVVLSAFHMKIVEFRIFVPISLSEFLVSKGYTTLQYIKHMNDGGGEGIEIVKYDEPFENETEKGIMSQKIYHIQSKIPPFIRWAVPEKYLHFHEVSYNSFPHTTTTTSIPSLGDDFLLQVESQHISLQYHKDEQKNENVFDIPENALNLNENELKIRKVVYLDLLNGPPNPSNTSAIPSFTDESDQNQTPQDTQQVTIRDFICSEIGMTKTLGQCDPTTDYHPDQIPAWAKHYDGEMILIIKTVRFNLKWWGIQTAVENLVANTFYPRLFTDTHRKLIMYSNEWKSLNLDDIHKLEAEEKAKQTANGKCQFQADVHQQVK